MGDQKRMDCKRDKITLYSPQRSQVAEIIRREGVCFSRPEFISKKYGESAPLFLTVYKGSALVGCMMTLLVFFLLTSVRSSLFAGWAPAMVADGMTARAALAESCKMAKERFGLLMSWYFAYYVLMFAATILLGVATFGIGSVFVIIVALLHTRIFDMVVYYRYKGRRYYVDVFNVIDPTIKQRTI